MGVLWEKFVEVMANRLFKVCEKKDEKKERECFEHICTSDEAYENSKITGIVRLRILEKLKDEMDPETLACVQTIGRGKQYTEKFRTWLKNTLYRQWLVEHGWDALVAYAEFASDKFIFQAEDEPPPRAEHSRLDLSEYEEPKSLILNKKYAVTFQPCLSNGQTGMVYVLEKTPSGKIVCLCPSAASRNKCIDNKKPVRIPERGFLPADEVGSDLLLGIVFIGMIEPAFHKISDEPVPYLTKQCSETNSHKIDEDKMCAFLQFLDKHNNWQVFKAEFQVVEEGK